MGELMHKRTNLMFQTADLVIVMPRSDPDLDGVACAVAYSELLTRSDRFARAWYPGEADGEAQFALQELLPAVSFATLSEVQSAKSFILVDSSDLDGIPSFIPSNKFIEIVDHRFYTSPSCSFPFADLQIESVGAAATLIAERYMKRNIVPSYASTALLFGAIHSNTIRLQGDRTTERDRTAEQWLNDLGLVPSDWLLRQFAHRRSEIIEHFGEMLRREKKLYRNEDIGEFAVSQLEFSGAEQMLLQKADQIYDFFKSGSSSQVALNLVDIDTARSYFVTPSRKIQAKVERSFEIKFVDDVAVFEPPLLRKQLIVAINS
jgi:manganese-dependent inorganic pyrophosphatase